MEGEKLKRAWGELLCSHTHKPHTKAHESFIPFPQNFTCGISSKHPSLVSPPPFSQLVRGIIQTEPCEPFATRPPPLEFDNTSSDIHFATSYFLRSNSDYYSTCTVGFYSTRT